MTDLADSQGSSMAEKELSVKAEIADGQSQGVKETVSSEERVSKFLKQGEEMLETFHRSIRAFEGQAIEIKTIGALVALLKQSVQAKRPLPEAEPGTSSSKKFRSDDDQPLLSVSDSEGDYDNPEDVDCIMNSSSATTDEHEFLEDLTTFVSEETAVGDTVTDKLAKIVDKSLRGHSDTEKIKKLRDHYKRPANVDNLQVPRIDKILWDQLKGQTKSQDVVRQKAVQRLQEGLLPLVSAMNHVATVSQPDVSVLKACIGDTFKLLCHSVIQTNNERRDTIKKEIQPKYKSICVNAVSATGLFGDSLGEDLKRLDTRAVKVTTKFPKRPFLEKPVGTGTQRMTHPNNKYPQQFPRRRPYQGPQQQTYFANGKYSNRP